MAEEFRVPHEVHHCKYRIVGCRLECGKRMRLHFRSEHEQAHCRLRTLWCARCNMGMHAHALEDHLTDAEFAKAFKGLSRADFAALPKWKRARQKKAAGIF